MDTHDVEVACRIVALTAAILTGVGCKDRSQNVASEVKVIGGQPAYAGQFPGVVALGPGPGCTGAVVGPRHIVTAAHCVVNTREDGTGIDPFHPGGKLKYSDAVDLHEAEFMTATIQSVKVHPEFLRLCLQDCFNLTSRPPFPPDVALIVVEDDLPDLAPLRLSISYATSAVDRIRVPPARFEVVGYGCDGGVNRRSFPRAQQWGVVEVGDREDLAGIRSLAEDPAGLMETYTVTRGRLLDRGNVSLCPGDSGGPLLYRDDQGTAFLIGINSSSWFPSDLSAAAPIAARPETLAEDVALGIPSVGLHTRIDIRSRFSVGFWLRRAIEVHRRSHESSPGGVRKD